MIRALKALGVRATATFALLVTAATAPVMLPASFAAAQACAVSSAPDAVSAAALAGKCARAVLVANAQSPTEQLFANADGTFTDIQWATPVRVRSADGAWRPTDLTLRADPGGAVSPTASPTPVTLSGGGTGPMAIVAAAGRQLVWSWPGYRLPVPALAGPTATYPDVLPGVDLRVTVDEFGFSEVLVVRTRAALADPALRQLRFRLSGSGLSGRGAAGSAPSMDAAVAAPFAIGQAAMWDSGRTNPTATDVISSPGGAGTGAKVLAMPTRMSGTTLVVTPDAAMLAAPDTTLPVFIDPTAKSTSATYWSMINKGHPNQEYWDYDRVSHAKVGNAGDGVNMYRSMFQFSTAAWKAKHVTAVTFNDNLVHSWACANTVTQLHLVPYTLSKSVTWNSPGTTWGTDYADRSSQNCNDAAGVVDSWASTSLTAAIQAQNAATWITVGLRAADETISTNGSNGWKKYQESGSDGPRLSVTFNTAPTVATSSMKLDSHSCGTSGNPSIVSTLNGHQPLMAATVTDAEGDKSTMTFTYPGGTKAFTQVASTTSISWGIPTAGIPAGTTVYSWKVTVTDGTDSSTSATCYFTVNNTIPAAPTVTSADGRYPDESLDPSPHDGVGKPGTFTIQAPNAVRYEWGFNLDDPTGRNSTTVATAGAAITVSATPPNVGENTVTAYAYTAAGVKSALGGSTFVAAAPDAPVGQWALDGDGSGTGPAGVGQPLAPAAVTWTADARVVGHTVATLNGGADLATSGPVVDTGTSFTVAAWVRLTSLPNSTPTIVSQNGQYANGFQLQGKANQWCVTAHPGDTLSAPNTSACGGAIVTGQWTHLVGVYDRSAGQLLIYVNDNPVPAGTIAYTATWNAQGAMQVGRRWFNDHYVDWVAGDVSAVQVWDRVLYPDEIAALDQPILAGRWTLADAPNPATGSDVEADATGAHPLRSNTVVSDFDTQNSVADAVFDGTHSAAVADGPVVRSDQSFTVAAWAQPAHLTATVTDGFMTIVSQNGAATSGLQLQYRYNAGGPGGDWCITERAADVNPTPAASLFIACAPIAATCDNVTVNTCDWVHLVGVYDALAGTIRLYVDGVPAGAPVAFRQTWNAGNDFVLGDRLTGTSPNDRWNGGLDNVEAYAGALTDHQVCELYHYGDAFSTNEGC